MKIAESWPFMDHFPQNHHRMFFWVHNNNSVKSKRKNKKMKKLGLKVIMPMLQKGQNSAWKWPNLGRLWVDFLQTTTEFLYFWFIRIILCNRNEKRKKLKKLGLRAFFVMMPMLRKRTKFGTKMAESWPFMDQFPHNHHIMSFLAHKNHYVKSKRKKWRN